MPWNSWVFNQRQFDFAAGESAAILAEAGKDVRRNVPSLKRCEWLQPAVWKILDGTSLGRNSDCVTCCSGCLNLNVPRPFGPDPEHREQGR